MISYSFSIQGKSHIERGTVCQDHSMTEPLRYGWHLGVVADGVGSAIHSEIGSQIAVECLHAFCQENIKAAMSDQQLEDMIYAGYEYTLDKIEQYAEQKNDNLENYDTTLSAVLYNGEKVIYGHAGDGGILVRLCDGRIIPVTERQKGADGSSVRPLRAGKSSWAFGKCEEKAAAVLLATDGMLDGVFQPVLVNLPSDITALASGQFSKSNVYVTACEFFMNPAGVYGNRQSSNADKIIKKYLSGNLERESQDEFLKYMMKNYARFLGKEKAMEVAKSIKKYYYAVWALKNVTDDKSVACLMNEKLKVTPQDVVYYLEPNWKWRQESYNALLYGKPMPPVPVDDPIYNKDGSDEKTEIKETTKDTEKKKNSPIRKNGYGYELDRRYIKIPIFIGMLMAAVIIFSFGIGFMIGQHRIDKGDNEMATEQPHNPTSSAIVPKVVTAAAVVTEGAVGGNFSEE